MSGYYSPENDFLMSFSQMKVWLECPARARAQFQDHTYTPELSSALAIGSLVDAMLLEPWNVEATEIKYAEFFRSAKNLPTADRKLCDKLVEACQANWFASKLIDKGEKQVELISFEVGGMKWKARLDLLIRDMGMLIDLKTSADLFGEEWSDEFGKTNFIGKYRYDMQLAVYREAIRQLDGLNVETCAILGLGKPKTNIPTVDVALFTIDPVTIENAFQDVKLKAEEVNFLRQSETAMLKRCEVCEYCRRSRTQVEFNVSLTKRNR